MVYGSAAEAFRSFPSFLDDSSQPVWESFANTQSSQSMLGLVSPLAFLLVLLVLTNLNCRLQYMFLVLSLCLRIVAYMSGKSKLWSTKFVYKVMLESQSLRLGVDSEPAQCFVRRTDHCNAFCLPAKSAGVTNKQKDLKVLKGGTLCNSIAQGGTSHIPKW